MKILRESKREIEFELEGETHTFYNLLKEYLLLDPNVEISAYKIEHPLEGTMRMYVKVKRGEVRRSIKRALERIIEDLTEIERQLQG